MKLIHSIIKKYKIIFSVIGVLAVCVGIYFIFFHRTPTYQFITVQRGSVTEIVSLTGNTTPSQSVSLTLGTSGTISHIYSALGDKVHVGQVLVELNTNDLLAQLHQAQANVTAQLAQLHQTEANVTTQQAKFEGLKAGSRPEDITLAEVYLNNAKTDLENTKTQQAMLVANAHRALLNSTLGAYITTNTGSTSTVTAPTISGVYLGTQEGAALMSTYETGNGEYFNVTGLFSASGPVTTNSVPLGSSGLYISFPSGFTASSWAIWSIPIPNTQASNYITNLNLYNNALTAQSTAVSQGEATVAQRQSELDLKRAGALPTDISAQQAQVEQAQANVAAQQAQVEQARASVESAIAKIQNAQILAPISGTVTQFDAKIGQLASPSTPLVSIMSSDGYEVDAGVSEIDVGKILVGDKVSMTLDAFPNETFLGSVFYIAPAQTNTQGAITYQIKIFFSKPDARLKSGLTANINIETNFKDQVLILPQYAILQNDLGTFIETIDNGKIKQNPVTLGIQDQKGNVEIVSGATEGEQVLNIGLKTL